MTWIRCPACRARRPESMPTCPVCSGPAGAAPRFDQLERRERAAWHHAQFELFVGIIGVIISLVTWLLGGCG